MRHKASYTSQAIGSASLRTWHSTLQGSSASIMSRICVKGVGKNTNEKQLRELFSSKGEVTDVKVITSKDGKSRKFAFVGFRTELQATEAQKHFNNTFIGMSKISVEMAKKFNDQSLKELKQKFAEKKTKGSKTKNASDDESEEPEPKEPQKKAKDESLVAVDATSVAGRKKAEFLEMMKSRRNTNKWANDDVAGTGAILDAKEAVPVSRSRKNNSDSDSEANNDSDSDESDSDNSVNDLVKGGPAPGTRPLSDLDYLRSKIKRQRSDSDSDSDSSSGEDSDGEGEKKASNKAGSGSDSDMRSDSEMEMEEEEENKQSSTDKKASKFEHRSEHTEHPAEDGEDEEDTSRLFVKNLPFSCTEEEFSSLFSTFGPISELHLPLDEEKRGKGYGFVQYMLPEHADAALQALAGEAFQGRVLFVVKARRPKEKDSTATIAAAAKGNKAKLSSFQLKKEEERRKFLNRKEGWNAAFVRSDAVVDSLAEKHGLTSADILDTTKSAGEMAVRLAVAEVQVVTENKDFLAQHGVDIDALESTHSANRAVARSTTTLLVKNLPATTVPDEIESMFARYGSIAAFIAPPSKTMVVVDFVEPSEARAAQKGLAYRSYKHSPLYIEWAPVSAINREKALKAAQKKNTKSLSAQLAEKDAAKSGADVKNGSNKTDEDNGLDYSSLFIKNLNFSTTEVNLRDHLLNLGVEGLRKVQITKKEIGKNLLSQGYGFAEFRTPEQAARALAKMKGSLLDSHALDVKPSDKRLTVAPAAAARSVLASSGHSDNSTNNKIIVRNVAFQATKAELRDLCAAYGSVKRVSIPKKMGGEHRGFAFVDFSTAQEAALAMASLKNTHLYGRHLVLEWAKEEDDQEGGAEGLGVGMSSSHGRPGATGNKAQAAGQQGQAGTALERLRKKARADEMVIGLSHKRARVQDVLEGSNGGIGSDDV